MIPTLEAPAAAQAETFEAERLREFSARVFQAFGVPADDAELAAGVLASADLRGIDTHGVARLPRYVEMLQQGRINPRPRIQVVRESPSTGTVDGDNGLGLVVGPRANEMAMEKAERVGTGWWRCATAITSGRGSTTRCRPCRAGSSAGR